MKTTTPFLVGMASIVLISCSGTDTAGGHEARAPASNDSSRRVASNLQKFDTLDFVAFSKQQLDRFKETHAEDIIVTFPDGRETRGLARHLDDMRAMFVPTPDLAITEHPVKIGNGSWTSVMDRMVGTFTKPMPMGNGKFIAPTGKRVDLMMTTVAHWNDAGRMDHEWLFWDNQTYMSQLGIKP